MTETPIPAGSELTVADVKALAASLMAFARYLVEHPDVHAALIAKAEQGSEEP